MTSVLIHLRLFPGLVVSNGTKQVCFIVGNNTTGLPSMNLDETPGGAANISPSLLMDIPHERAPGEYSLEHKGSPVLSEGAFTDRDPYSPISDEGPYPVANCLHRAERPQLSKKNMKRLHNHSSMMICPYKKKACAACGSCCQYVGDNAPYNGFHHNRRCMKCKTVRYCSTKCQMVHRPVHKPNCTPPPPQMHLRSTVPSQV